MTNNEYEDLVEKVKLYEKMLSDMRALRKMLDMPHKVMEGKGNDSSCRITISSTHGNGTDVEMVTFKIRTEAYNKVTKMLFETYTKLSDEIDNLK